MMRGAVLCQRPKSDFFVVGDDFTVVTEVGIYACDLAEEGLSPVFD
jgi:hypothetical protein